MSTDSGFPESGAENGDLRRDLSAGPVWPDSQVSIGRRWVLRHGAWTRWGARGCGSKWFSSAATRFIEGGAACPSCGDRLVAPVDLADRGSPWPGPGGDDPPALQDPSGSLARERHGGGFPSDG